jgi:uncharacterized protein
MDGWSTATAVAVAGGLGGILLGLAARLGKFCTLASIEDAMFGGDYRRLRMWAFALAMAIMGVYVTSALGWVDYSRSPYHTLALNPAAWIVGGLLFGMGMAFCGTCAYGTLARVGGGDLRALFVFLVLGISAYMAIAGPTAQLRIATLNKLALDLEDASYLAHTFTQLSAGAFQDLAPLTAATMLAGWALYDRNFRTSPRHVFSAIAVGAAITSGWLGTGLLGADPFEPQPLTSHTFSVPLGQTLIFFMTMSSSTVTFGVGATLGVVFGAFLGALIKKEFRWEAADDARETRRHLLGAFMMGTGGVFAGGCTIGQGLSAASVLAISAPVVMASIWFGVWLGLTILMEGGFSGALRHLTGR